MRKFFQGPLGISEASSPRKMPEGGGEAIEGMLESPKLQAKKGGFRQINSGNNVRRCYQGANFNCLPNEPVHRLPG